MVLAVDVHMHAHDLYRHGLLLATEADDGALHGFQRVRSLSDVQFHSPFVSWTTTFLLECANESGLVDGG